MSYREFLVSDDDVVLDVLGVLPEHGQEVAIRTLRFEAPGEVDESVEFTYDVTGRSIRFTWLCGQSVLVDIFREGATALSVSDGRDGAVIEVRFETESLGGRLRIAVRPRISVSDELLLR